MLKKATCTYLELTKLNINHVFIAQSATLSVLLAILVCWPVARIAGRVGFSRWWALVALIPVVNLVLVYVFAFVKWPADQGAENAE